MGKKLISLLTIVAFCMSGFNYAYAEGEEVPLATESITENPEAEKKPPRKVSKSSMDYKRQIQKRNQWIGIAIAASVAAIAIAATVAVAQNHHHNHHHHGSNHR